MGNAILSRVRIGPTVWQIGVKIGATLTIVRLFHARRILIDTLFPAVVRGNSRHVIVEPLVDETAQGLEPLRRGTRRHLLGKESVIVDGRAKTVAIFFGLRMKNV